MGNQFAKAYQLIFITANQIAYPENEPANTPIKKQSNQQQKKNKINFLNIKDQIINHHGWLPINLDFSKFIPKKFYKQANDIEVQNHLKALQKKQSLLKQFKYHQDFDRIDFATQHKSSTNQIAIEKILVTHAALLVIVSRLVMSFQYYHQFSLSLWKRTFFKCYFVTLPLPIFVSLITQASSPINQEYFRQNQNSKRVYQGFAYDLDAYQYVNDIKYNYKYPSREQYGISIKNISDKIDQNMYEQSLQYFKKKYGIVQTQRYLQKNNDI